MGIRRGEYSGLLNLLLHWRSSANQQVVDFSLSICIYVPLIWVVKILKTGNSAVVKNIHFGEEDPRLCMQPSSGLLCDLA